jgi:type IV secretion system protein VirB10
MPAISAIGAVIVALLLQGPANLQVSENAKVPAPNIVPKGTVIPIELLTRISTKTVKEGDGVYGKTVFPVTLNNAIVIPVGSSVRGKITEVQRPGKVKGKAGLALSFQTLILPTGSTIPLYASLAGSSDAKTDGEGKLEGDSSKGADAATVGKVASVPAGIGGVTAGRKGAGIGAAGGAAAGLATVLLTRGKDLVLDRGTTLEIVLDQPLEP